MSIGTFTIIKNESDFVGYCIMSVLNYVDEMVFSDGNSTDGTLEIIKYIQQKYDKDNKIKLFENKDCKDLKQAYVDLFNWTIKKCKFGYIWFLHPDMICINPEKIKVVNGGMRYSTKMVSIAGEDKDKIFLNGRDDKWATIYRNDYGIHYHGFYGSRNEDLYFGDITGNEHIFYKDRQYLPYDIVDTDIELYHYCDTKPYLRRFNRMKSVLEISYPHLGVKDINDLARSHPRVSLDDGQFFGRDFKFGKFNRKQPEVFEKYGREFEKFRR